MTITRLLAALVFLTASVGCAQAEIVLPSGAELRSEKVEATGIYALPTGPWQEVGGVPSRPVSGAITWRAWRIGGTARASAEILKDLRDQLVAQGYQILFECEAKRCGGFDFRYGTDVIDEPEMHVNLGDFRFLSAVKPENAPDAVSLLISRTASAAFVQIVQVAKEAAITPEAEIKASTKAVPDSAMPAEPQTSIDTAMAGIGRFVLSDLVFATGSAELGPGDFTSLKELASYLLAHPDKRVALVGHTDAQGSLAGNISLSKRRAQSVLQRLVNDYGVPPAQLEAEGIGYLSPVASNQTDEGRTRNRRVEAILVSTQ